MTFPSEDQVLKGQVTIRINTRTHAHTHGADTGTGEPQQVPYSKKEERDRTPVDITGPQHRVRSAPRGILLGPGLCYLSQPSVSIRNGLCTAM